MIEALNSWARKTRFEIATAVVILCQFYYKPIAFPVNTTKRVFGYLKRSIQTGLNISLSSNGFKFTFFSNSDFAGDKFDWKSRSSWVGFWNARLLTWNTRKQARVSLSLAERSYLSLSEFLSGPGCTLNLISEKGISEATTPQLFVHNDTAITCAENRLCKRYAKDKEIWYHFVSNMVVVRLITIVHITSENNNAYFFTKPLEREIFLYWETLLISKELFLTRRGIVRKQRLSWVALRVRPCYCVSVLVLGVHYCWLSWYSLKHKMLDLGNQF